MRYDERPADHTPIHTDDLPLTPVRDRNILVFHVRDGRTSEVWQFWTDQYAADAFFG